MKSVRPFKFFVLTMALLLLADRNGFFCGIRNWGFKAPHNVLDQLTADDLPDDSPAPGESLDYASSNTFVLSYALTQYVKAREGADADFWFLVKENVLKPMGIEHLPVARTIENDGSLGTPIMGWGSYPSIIEAVKIARLLYNEGVFQGKKLLNRDKVREALYRTSRQG